MATPEPAFSDNPWERASANVSKSEITFSEFSNLATAKMELLAAAKKTYGGNDY